MHDSLKMQHSKYLYQAFGQNGIIENAYEEAGSYREDRGHDAVPSPRNLLTGPKFQDLMRIHIPIEKTQDTLTTQGPGVYCKNAEPRT